MTLLEKNITKHIIDLSKQFIAIRSTADNSQGLEEVLSHAKRELQGYYAMEEFENNGIKSLLVHNTTERTKHFKIILNAHLDVVPAKEELFYPFIKNGKLYGRGSYDMKAATAAMILLFKEQAKKIAYPLALQLSTDEETGSIHSTEYQIQKGIKGDFVIVGECGSDLQIKNKGKGFMVLKLTTKGKSAHGAYPWLANNAIMSMHKVLNDLQKIYPTPRMPVWKSTVTTTKLETPNTTFNIIPDVCTAYIDVRYIPEDEDTILEDIRKNIHGSASVEVILRLPSHTIDAQNSYIKLLQNETSAVTKKETNLIVGHGGSDMRLFPNAAVEFGPVGGNQHADNEWIDIKSLEQYYHILKNFLFSVK